MRRVAAVLLLITWPSVLASAQTPELKFIADTLVVQASWRGRDRLHKSRLRLGFVAIYTECWKNGVYYMYGQNQHCDR
jgi:hypothetical protein